jgi:hypothetical protein
MGVNTRGFSHVDELECHTCHSSFIPSCYGCHVELDLSRDARLQTSGASSPGLATTRRGWVALNDLVLMRNAGGRIAPSVPSERFFITVTDGGSATRIHNRPRRFELPDGRVVAGFGQRAFDPHTTRRRSQFMACNRCHSEGDSASPQNAVLLDLSHGFGTMRFPFEACDVTNGDDSCSPETDVTMYPLDAIQTRAGLPLVVAAPRGARPLSLEEVARMRAVVVPVDTPIRTDIPPGAARDPSWPRAQQVE